MDGAAVPWARDVLRGTGADPGPAELVKDRPWSTVWRLPTPAGPVWLKACPERTRHEVRMLAAVARWDVPHVLVPLAVEEDRGWVLLPDGGPTVRDVQLPPAAAERRWADALTAYGEVQRATAAHADDLVALGVPDLRLPHLPATFERLAHRWAPDLLHLASRVREECAELAAVGLEATLQHDDLHDGNVFARGLRPFDWGDACVGHPWSSLLVALDAAPEGPAPDPDSRAAGYLAGWPPVGDPARVLQLAVRLAVVSRADSWDRALVGWPEAPEEFRSAPGDWLRRLL
ncbi:aminoglycoside phosphotransferase family protein [Kineococcus sp. NPDC059986]|uniref:aminoglycoside phosphotransferase family protein n=1 Tax=Kineococcus sp. NPDC059986 TaxID=3155538 RepID=UPI00344E26C3